MATDISNLVIIYHKHVFNFCLICLNFSPADVLFSQNLWFRHTNVLIFTSGSSLYSFIFGVFVFWQICRFCSFAWKLNTIYKHQNGINYLAVNITKLNFASADIKQFTITVFFALQTNSFSKCTTCTSLDRQLENTICPKKRAELHALQEIHNERQM